MSRTNCINCGAAKDIDEIKCPFCGTTYFDMTAIDLDEGTPVALSVRKGDFVFQMLAKPELKSISVEDEIAPRAGWRVEPLLESTRSRIVTAGLNFIAIPRRREDCSPELLRVKRTALGKQEEQG